MTQHQLITQERGPSLEADDLEIVRRGAAVIVAVLDEIGDELVASSGVVDVILKDDGTPVTASDVDTSDRLTAAILAAFPDHCVISEEAETTRTDARWTWVIDPIDGTANFAAGVPNWCVAVALCRDGWPVLGIVDIPVQARRQIGIHGHGATLERWRRDGTSTVRATHVRDRHDVTDPDDRHAPVFVTSGTIRRAKGIIAVKGRVLGAAAHDFALVAANAGVGAVSRVPKVWDVAAGMVLVHESGGAIAVVDEPPFFPLEAGRDYGAESRITVAGINADWIASFIEHGQMLD